MSTSEKTPEKSKTGGVKSGTSVPVFRSRDDRITAGKTLRDSVPRQSHAKWEPPANRRDPIDLLKESNLDRMPELVAALFPLSLFFSW